MKRLIIFLSVMLLLTPFTALAQPCEGNFDCDQDVDGTDAAVFKSDFGRSGFKNPCPTSSNCCSGTLSPLGRWCDQNNGTVKDMTTGLVWLKNAGWGGAYPFYADTSSGVNAQDRAAQLWDGSPWEGSANLSDGSVEGDWRLPTKSELWHITLGDEYIRYNQMYFFTNVQASDYWSSSTNISDSSCAWYVALSYSYVYYFDKAVGFYVWPVRGGRGSIPEGLVSYWRFDEGEGTTAFDSVDGNNGTINGATWTTGKANGALSFDGINDYVVVPQDQSMDITNSVTVEAWIYPQAFPYQQSILHRWYDGTEPDRGIAFSIREGSYFEFHVISEIPVYAPYSFQANTWYHVAGTWNGSTIRAYVDGVEIGNRTTSGTFINQNVDLGIGADPRTDWGYFVNNFNGKIDEVAFYSRALSPQEIQQHYQRGLNGKGYY